MSFAIDLEHDLWKYCLKQEGRWWAKLLNIIPFFWWVNKEVKELYLELRALDPGTVMCIVQDGGPDYQKYIDYKERLDKIQEQRDGQPSVEGEPTFVNDPGFPDAVVQLRREGESSHCVLDGGLYKIRAETQRHCQFRFHTGET